VRHTLLQLYRKERTKTGKKGLYGRNQLRLRGNPYARALTQVCCCLLSHVWEFDPFRDRKQLSSRTEIKVRRNTQGIRMLVEVKHQLNW